MKSRRQHFFLRIANCDTSMVMRIADKVRTLGSVRDSGMGTAKDPKSGWVELYAKDWIASIPSLRQNLNLLGIDEKAVPEIVEIERGEGKAQAKQLDLFGAP